MISLLDTHQHLVYREKASYGWTKDIPPLAEGNFTLDDYKTLTEGLGIGGTLFMETGVDDPDYQQETRFVKSLADNSDNGMIGLISSIRPESDEAFETWLEETIEMGVVGYRRILHVMPDDTSQSDIFRKNVRKIGVSGKTFDICFLPGQLPIACELAKACENTKLILNHCGVPDIAGNGLDPWRQDIKALAQIPNVICKLSGLMAYCAPGTSSLETIEPYVDHVLNCFGPNRMVWGSDWPVVNLAKGLPEWIAVTRKILGKLSADEASSIAYGTAQIVYKVKIQS
jgi:predicted TIM-barrel fold metal-dependent hydrolase|tara:strand:+ start:268 stop:1125 length:858 start_codon:yes stop_codon:yes gene_type:complete